MIPFSFILGGAGYTKTESDIDVARSLITTTIVKENKSINFEHIYVKIFSCIMYPVVIRN